MIDLALAMECRCYRGGEGRTRMKQLRLSSLDAAAAVVMAAMFGLILALNTLFPPVL